MLVVGELPAGPYDQRDCCGAYREQRNQTGGLGVSSLGRPSSFLNKPFEPTAVRTTWK
jgi:hypothetical protein